MTNKQYGIRFVYVGCQENSEVYFYREEDRDSTFEKILATKNNKINLDNKTIVNFDNIMRIEKINK